MTKPEETSAEEQHENSPTPPVSAVTDETDLTSESPNTVEEVPAAVEVNPAFEEEVSPSPPVEVQGEKSPKKGSSPSLSPERMPSPTGKYQF